MARDDSYEGRAYVGVTSTGIFCRLTCPAQAKFENCQFYATPGPVWRRGFAHANAARRWCGGGQDETVLALLAALRRAAPVAGEEDITRMGYDPSTVRRAFKRRFGMTFLEMARQRRLREGFTTLVVSR